MKRYPDRIRTQVLKGQPGLLGGPGVEPMEVEQTLYGNRAERRALLFPRGVRNGVHAQHTRKRRA